MGGVHLLALPNPKGWNGKSLRSWKTRRSRMMEFPVELPSLEEGDGIGWS